MVGMFWKEASNDAKNIECHRLKLAKLQVWSFQNKTRINYTFCRSVAMTIYMLDTSVPIDTQRSMNRT